jgi:polyphosphate kinase
MRRSDFDNSEYYINRELSWLSFNERVLEEAMDQDNPLLEQLKFIAITASNLDEFFMVRVAGLKDDIRNGVNRPDNKAHMTPKEQIRAISQRVHEMVKRQYEILNHHIIPRLRRQGIHFLSVEEMNAKQRDFVQQYFLDSIFPVLTPMAVDASHPFPMLANKSLNLAVLLERDHEPTKHLFAVVQVPGVLPRFVQLPSEQGRLDYVLLEDVICQHMKTMFAGHRVLEVSPFRITRDMDMELDEESAEDLLKEIEKELKRRKLGEAVRLEVAMAMSQEVRETLRTSLDLGVEDIYLIEGPLDPTFYMKFYGLPGYEHLRFEELTPQPPRDLIGEQGIFEAIANKDILVMHPFESFEPVVHFVNQAADDPHVLAIKQTLYRVSGNSPIVAALARAADNGKQVTVLLELKARFDEENNIVWAKKLEKAGCHVIYGLVGLKTHSKITLVARQEGQRIRRYVHLGTGNYNDTTARIYTDVGMFTADEGFGQDASAFFNHLTGYATAPEWKRIETAPRGLKEKFLELIENEIEKSTEEKPGHIIAKMNALTHKEIIKALYRASCAGVKIDLIVRGICCLRPGIQDVSENIRVYSIVGRFLEHSRIFYFQNGGDELLFCSSADWMTRNLDHRVEILFPVVQSDLKERLKESLQIMLSDTVKRHELESDGVYKKVQPGPGPAVDSQAELYKLAFQAARIKEMNLYLTQLKPKTHRLDT